MRDAISRFQGGGGPAHVWTGLVFGFLFPIRSAGSGTPDVWPGSGRLSWHMRILGIPRVYGVVVIDEPGMNGSGFGLVPISSCDSRFSPRVRGLKWLTDYSRSQSCRLNPWNSAGLQCGSSWRAQNGGHPYGLNRFSDLYFRFSPRVGCPGRLAWRCRIAMMRSGHWNSADLSCCRDRRCDAD